MRVYLMGMFLRAAVVISLAALTASSAATAQPLPTLGPLDASGRVTYFIEDGQPGSTYVPADRELATWALKAWERVSNGRFRFEAAPRADALVRVHWVPAGGGQYGEITVAMQYGFQSWNAHIPGKYRDMLFGIGAEEFGHVEMLATMIAQLLEKAPVGITSDAIQKDPTVAAVLGGTDLQHAIVAGAGALVTSGDGAASPVKSTRAHTTLRPPSSAVQPCAAESWATR